MATKKKEVKVRDLKPSKDAKGGAARAGQSSTHGATNRQSTLGANRAGSTNRSSTLGASHA